MTFGSELFGPLPTVEDLLTEPLEYRDGHLYVPQGPGLGVTVDGDKIRHFSFTE